MVAPDRFAKDTWESANGCCASQSWAATGAFTASCGVELSALYFQMSYPALDGKFGSAVTVLAPLRGRPAHALRGAGRQRQRHLSGRTRDPRHPPGALLQTEYDSGSERLYRPAPDLQISRGEAGDTVWARRHPDTAGQLRRIHCGRAKKTWVIAALGCFWRSRLLSFFLSRRFVRPITDSLKRFQLEEMPEPGYILRHLRGGRARGVPARPGAEPNGWNRATFRTISRSLFDQFVERKDLLTEAERISCATTSTGTRYRKYPTSRSSA